MLFSTKKRKIITITISFFIFVGIVYFGYYSYISSKHSEGVRMADQGLALVLDGDYEGAKKVLNSALDLVNKEDNISKSRIYKNFAFLYESMGETDLVADSYLKAKALFDENDSEYYSFLAQVNLLERDLNSAVSNFKKAIEIDGNNFDANNNLGLLYLGELIYGVEPNFEMALPYNKKTVDIEKTPTTIETLAVNYYLLKKYDKALPLFIELSLLRKNDGFSNEFIGLIYFNKRDFLPAKIFLSKAIDFDPSLKTEEIDLILEAIESELSNIITQ